MSSTRADRGRSGSLAGLRLCMAMHVGNSGGSRAWQGLLGRPPDWGIDPPRSTGVRKGSSYGSSSCRRFVAHLGLRRRCPVAVFADLEQQLVDVSGEAVVTAGPQV